MRRRSLAEFVGTCLLLYAIVGSGMAVQTSSPPPALYLFAHAATVGASLAVLIALLGPVSGAHLNPAVTFAFWRSREMGGKAALGYITAQTLGAMAGVLLAHASFERALVSISRTDRSGFGPALAEVVSTSVLVLLIGGLARTNRAHLIAGSVGLWVGATIFATSSTGFSNPAVTLARSLTDTFAGIAPDNVPAFILSQLIGAMLATTAVRSFFRTSTVRPPHREEVRA